MTNDEGLLTAVASGGVHLVTLPRDGLDRSRRELRLGLGVWPVLVRGARCSRLEGLYAELSAALQFPFHFSSNWNSFNDLVQDLGWLPDPTVVLIANAGQLLSDADEETQKALGNLLRRAAPVVRPGPRRVRPVAFVLSDDAEQLRATRRRLGLDSAQAPDDD